LLNYIFVKDCCMLLVARRAGCHAEFFIFYPDNFRFPKASCSDLGIVDFNIVS